MPRLPRVDPEAIVLEQFARLSRDLPAEFLRDLAQTTKFAQRIKKIDPALFVWNLVFGFGTSLQRTLADLKRRYCTITAETLAPASFFDRFNDRLVSFLEAILQHLLANTARSTIPRKILKSFKDVLIFDNTIVRLIDSLADVFPGTGMPAGVKISTILSVAQASLKRVAIYPGNRADIKTIRLGTWVKDHLLLFDLGYFKYALMERIQRMGGHFITRLHGNADPVIVSVNQTCRGRSVALIGKKLRDCLPSLKRGVLDAMVEVDVSRRVYRGKETTAKKIFRLVGILNGETQEYHIFLTDLGPEQFSAEKIADLYRGRWFVELMFKELKSRYGLDVIVTTKPEIVKAIIYSAMITLVISRKLFVGYRDAMSRGGRNVTQERWAKFLVENSGDILREVLRQAEIPFTEKLLWQLKLRETEDPTPERERLQDVWDA